MIALALAVALAAQEAGPLREELVLPVVLTGVEDPGDATKIGRAHV